MPQFSLRKLKKQQPVAGQVSDDPVENSYPRVQIDEIYEPNKQLKLLIGQVKDIKLEQYYSEKECRDLLSQYIKENNLVLRGMVKVDPYIAPLISSKLINSDGTVQRDALIKRYSISFISCVASQVTSRSIIK